ncbi:MAG: TIGR03862 family flavoprotein [Hyphomicrobiales bacterium]
MVDVLTPTCAIIGGGPAGLMAAETLALKGVEVHLFDAKPTFGRKFLMAGKSGLNITKSDHYVDLLRRFVGRNKELESSLLDFESSSVVEWCEGLGQETFVGTSGRVFPKSMKASPLLRAWLQRLTELGVTFHARHRWAGFDGAALLFEAPDGPLRVEPKATIFALGGKSWSRLGSDGAWAEPFNGQGVELADFQPSNCGFDCAWDEHFSSRFEGEPVKNVTLTVDGKSVRGDFVVTKTGIEGGVVYTQSAAIRDRLLSGQGEITLDLLPDVKHGKLTNAFARDRGKNSFSNHARKVARLKGVKLGLLRLCAPDLDVNNAEDVASQLKALKLPVTAARPIDEAISTAGGVMFDALDEHLMLKTREGTFVAGEMLDWDAPTGGYLITACLATGRRAGRGALEWLSNDGGEK